MKCKTCKTEISDHVAIVFFGVVAKKIDHTKVLEYECQDCSDGHCRFKLARPANFITIETTVSV